MGFGKCGSAKGYAFACLTTKNYDELGTLIPDLLKHKGEDIEIFTPIFAYAAEQHPPNKELFLKAIEGVSDATILQNTKVTQNFIIALRIFGEMERARILEEKAAKIKQI